jgi:dTDP-4-dehydrorhamnose reductase
MLGSDVTSALVAAGVSTRAYDLPEFDLCRPDDLARALAGVTAVVNCAAYTNVDGAEKEQMRAEAVNATAVGQLGRMAAAQGIHVVHISTDFVFDGGLDRPYTEMDAPCPLSVYGRTKLAGELALAAAGGAAAVIRVQWTYGAAGVNFVRKVVERARAASEIRMVTDQVGSPTWTRDVAAVLLLALDQRLTGLYHYAAAGYASRFQIASFILGEMGLARQLVPCRTADFPAAAARPLNSRFDCAKIESQLGLTPPRWEESLGEFIRGTLMPQSP